MNMREIRFEIKSDVSARCIGHLTRMITEMEKITDLEEKVLKRMSVHGYIVCCLDSGYIDKDTVLKLEDMLKTLLLGTGEICEFRVEEIDGGDD